MKAAREKGVWYVLEAGPYNQALVGLNRDEIAAWAISLGKALARQERGINAFADDLIDERERYLETRRETGKLGGCPPSKGHPRVTLGSPPGDGGAVPNRTPPNHAEHNRACTPSRGRSGSEAGAERTENRRHGGAGGEFKDAMGVGKGQDRYERIASIPQDELAKAVVAFCNEEDPNRAMAVYKRIIRVIGPEAFRSEFAAFVGECGAGEEPDRRGAAFTARVKRLFDEKKDRIMREAERIA